MNLENLNTVALWLEAGAPEHRFSMSYALASFDREIYPDELSKDQRDKPNCGTVCCIGGYAA